MKIFTKLTLSAIAVLFLLTNIQAQTIEVQVTGEITTNTNWTNNYTYILNGFVYVKNNSTLTIEPGTVIKGDLPTKGSLIITKGSKLIADGTKAQPIVFTSNQIASQRTYGDWGGVILLGNAPINQTGGSAAIEGGVDNANGDGQYGGTNPTDNSGVLRYVRIEFAGIAFLPNNEINGLTLGGVGNGTTIDHVQISYANDDAIECFGGTVNMSHLVLYNALDDDLDSDNGYSGHVQFVVIKRDPNVADAAGASNSFESDNDATGSANTPQTSAVYSNITVVGPLEDATTNISSYYKRGSHIRRNSAISIYNSALIGYPFGLLIDAAASETNATNDLLQFRNNIIAGCTTPLAVNTGSTFDINTWFNTPSYSNSILTNSSDVQLTLAYGTTLPFNFLPLTGSPLLSGASFTATNLTDPFLQAVSYRGAFGSEDWTTCWTEYNPIEVDYSGPINFGPEANFGPAINDSLVTMSNQTLNAISYSWDFGDPSTTNDVSTLDNPTYIYSVNGSYTVTLIATNSCGSDTISNTFNIDSYTGINNISIANNILLYPNPTANNSVLSFNNMKSSILNIYVSDLTGKIVKSIANSNFNKGENKITFSVNDLASGLYLININNGVNTQQLKLSVIK